MVDGHIVCRQAAVGVMGLGDLGRQLAAQLLDAGRDVIGYDPAMIGCEISSWRAGDPAVSTKNLTLVSDPLEVLERVELLHWAVPSALLAELPPIGPTQTVLLHDSVMSSSLAAARARQEASQFQIVHCLMNTARRVFVATDLGCVDAVSDHLSDIGLAPKLTTVQEHDRMIARTQGIFALLISLGLADELQRQYEDGDLTPSAQELRRAVQHRQSRWTKATVKSILSNRELSAFLDDLRSVVPT